MEGCKQFTRLSQCPIEFRQLRRLRVLRRSDHNPPDFQTIAPIFREGIPLIPSLIWTTWSKGDVFLFTRGDHGVIDAPLRRYRYRSSGSEKGRAFGRIERPLAPLPTPLQERKAFSYLYEWVLFDG